MVIWLALLLPVLLAVVLHFGFRHRIVWWELLIPFGLSLVLVGLSKLLITAVQTDDTEYLTSWAEQVEYWEDWSEWVTETETYTDSKGKTQTRQVDRLVYHPPEYGIRDSGGRWLSISWSRYCELKNRFGNEKYESVFRFGRIVKSGGKYISIWPKNDATMEVLTTTHHYENRVQASLTVFGHRRIDKQEKEQYGLFDYPSVNDYRQSMLLGHSDPTAERLLALHNAKFGASHQIRMWVLVFRNQPMEAAIAQESYWDGGNKNELVLCVGVDDINIVQWGYVFSWTEKETFKADCRTQIELQISKPLDAPKLINDTAGLVPIGWERKQFKDFSYLSVEPPVWAVVLVYVMVLIACVGCGVWSIGNDINPTE